MARFPSITFFFTLLLPAVSFSKADTLGVYQMGKVGRIDGLSYGSEHTVILFTDSTFSYTIKSAMQISTSKQEVATGKWTLKKDTLVLTGTGKSVIPNGHLSSGYRDTRKNLLFWTHFYECISCFNLKPIIIYSSNKAHTYPVDLQPEPVNENEKKLGRPVPGLRMDLEVDLNSYDSVSVGGITLKPDGKNHNETSISVYPDFHVKLVPEGNGLQVAGRNVPKEYWFEKK